MKHAKPEVLKLTCKYGKIGWIVYSGEQNISGLIKYETRSEARRALKRMKGNRS